MFKKLLLMVFFLLKTGTNCYSQVTNDSVATDSALINKQLKYHYLADFFSSLSITHIANALAANEKGSIYFYYNVTLSGDLQYKKIMLSSYYNTDFGINSFIDSIAIIQTDQFNFKNSLTYKFNNSKFGLNLTLLSRSQYFQHYNYSVDSTGKTVSSPASSYKSPGYSMFSGGLRYSSKTFSVEFGLVNGMKTIMRDQHYFDLLKTDNLYGVEKGKKQKFDFGFSLIVAAPLHRIYKNIYYENFSQARVVMDDLSYLHKYCFDMNQAFHFIFFKYFRLSVRSKVVYDYHINLKVNTVNSLTLGFYFHNSL